MSIRAPHGRSAAVALSIALLFGPTAAAGAGTAPPPTAPAGAMQGGTSAQPADPWAGLNLPDLAMARTTDLKLVDRPDGRLELRFSSTVVNLGRGPLSVTARRAAPGRPWSVSQQIFGEDGSVVREVPLPLSPIWGGDGHNHWHIPGVARYRLLRLSDGHEVGANHKIGFCFFDNKFIRDLPNTPDTPSFPNDHGCAHGDHSAKQIRMGLSVGWGDVYRWAIPGQSIDITDLPGGSYRLEGQANGEDLLHESDDTDNLTWTDFALTRHGRHTALRVLGNGSNMPPDSGDRGSIVLGGGGDDNPAAGAGPQSPVPQCEPAATDCSRRD